MLNIGQGNLPVNEIGRGLNSLAVGCLKSARISQHYFGHDLLGGKICYQCRSDGVFNSHMIGTDKLAIDTHVQ